MCNHGYVKGYPYITHTSPGYDMEVSEVMGDPQSSLWVQHEVMVIYGLDDDCG